MAQDFEQRVYDVLAELGVPYTRRVHPPVFTVEQAKLYDEGLPGAHCKNLFLRDKKGSRHFLAVFDERNAIDLGAVGMQSGAGRLSFASPERLEHILGLTPGAVGPFGLLHPAAREVCVLLDGGLLSASHVSFHPNVNTATLTLPLAGFQRYLAWAGNAVIIVPPKA